MKYTYFVSYEYLYQIGNIPQKTIQSEVYELDFKIECEETFEDLIRRIKHYKSHEPCGITPINIVLLKEEE